MEPVEVSKLILEKVNQIEKTRTFSKKRGDRKSLALSNYDRALATTIVKLKNGVEFEIDGEKIVNPPATLIEKIAKGICYEEVLEKEVAEIEYKSLISNLNALQSELNGLQSINRYQSDV